MRVVLWIGNEANQKALANKIHENFPLAGIVTETRKSKSNFTIKKLGVKVIEKIFLGKIGRAWFNMLRYFQQHYPLYPPVPLLDIGNINNDAVYKFTKELQPDLIIVSGTRMIKGNLLSIEPVIGIINLHTGLSPYIKGGPNCTNWCLSMKQFHLIGNTIMWIDKGIDTGNIIATEFTQFTGNESLLELHIKVMEHAHDLYLRSIQNINEGYLNSIPQEKIASGATYYTRQWGLKEKMRLVRNFSQFRQAILSGAVDQKRSNIRTISLNKTI